MINILFEIRRKPFSDASNLFLLAQLGSYKLIKIPPIPHFIIVLNVIYVSFSDLNVFLIVSVH
ncbi:hypothetical protein HanRHA438_Chr14g0653611 [Helianthus annuus]|nr:hypothetical protein HanRHA438_Chr14g0653611 [Helianthus annuus]